MIPNLAGPQIVSLIETVFRPRPDDRALTFLVDLPYPEGGDTPAWKDRRRIAAEWYSMVLSRADSLPFEVINCCVYPNVGTNNGDLPKTVSLVHSSRESAPAAIQSVELEGLLSIPGVVISITEFSATAPLKVLARKFPFRGATLPGFTRAMIPALLLDYDTIHARVMGLKQRMDRADGATVVLSSRGREYRTFYDLRFREGHASGGIIRDPGTVANLPSGEAYIVPYEGEEEGHPSRTTGILPLQVDDEIVEFEIVNNQAVNVLSSGINSDELRHRINEEPAFGNISELGIGVLGDWGIKACGSTLLDEKLGLHIAFGRSDHFGGVVGPGRFRNPANVVHIDWVYVPSIQPEILVESVVLHYGQESEMILENGSLLRLA